MHIYFLQIPFFGRNFLEEDVTIQDLETLKKVELNALIKKYGQRRRFARVLIQWMILKRSLPVDPELLMVYTFSLFLFSYFFKFTFSIMLYLLFSYNLYIILFISYIFISDK